MTYRFYDMGDKPLAFDVKCGKKVVLSAGTVGVKIAFGQSRLTRIDGSGKTVNMNVYMAPDGKIYHA